MFLPSLIQTEKAFPGNDVPKKARKQGLSRSIADFGSPVLLYGIVAAGI